MEISYLRSSSYNTYSLCELQYYGIYVLGIKDLGGRASILGTCFHAVMELLAKLKYAFDKEEEYITDDIVGKIPVELDCDIDYFFEKIYKYYTENNSHIEWAKANKTNCLKWIYNTCSYS